jgi:hypothetical protein
MTNRPDRRTLRLPHRGAVATTTALWTRPAGDLDRVGPVHGSSRHFDATRRRGPEQPFRRAYAGSALHRAPARHGETRIRSPDTNHRHHDHLGPDAEAGEGELRLKHRTTEWITSAGPTEGNAVHRDRFARYRGPSQYRCRIRRADVADTRTPSPVIDGSSHPDIEVTLGLGEVHLEACRPD